MLIHYKLYAASSRGILLTKETPLLDTDSGFLLAFDLPEPGEYVAVLIGQDGREHALRIGAEPVPLPPYLAKPQLVQVSVLQIKDAKPFKRWVCPALRLVSLAAQGKLMYQVVEDYPGLPKQVSELEGLVNSLTAENRALRTEMQERGELFKGALAVKEQQITALSDAYNAAVHAYNALEDRVTQIEAKYDPARM